MRVISGEAKGHKLFAPKGLNTRPTADRVKESVFSMLTEYIPSSCVLDLFSGSGAMGIEALSRGASSVVFVDNNSESVRIIEMNLKKTRFSDKSSIMKADVLWAIPHLKDKKFDVILMDPPYHSGLIQKTINLISETDMLSDFGIILAEDAPDSEFVPMYDSNVFQNLEIFKTKNYNIAKIIMLRRKL